jgi:hypothetical protein
MVAASSVIALVFGWGVAHAQEASPGGVPGQAQPVAPSTGQGDIDIETKPGLPEGTKLTQPMVPGTTTFTRVESGSSTTTTTTPGGSSTTTTTTPGTTTTTPGQVKVEVEQPPGQPPPNVDVNVTPAPGAPPTTVRPSNVPPPTARTGGGTPAPVPTPGGEQLAPEAQMPAQNNGVTEMSAPVAGQPVPYPSERPYQDPYSWSRGIGTGLLVGGGFEEFTSNSMQNITGPGGSWNARFVAGTHKYIGAEAAYSGAAHSIDALGLSNTAVLVANGVEGIFRLNLPLITRGTLLEPFGFAGVGYSRYVVTNTNTVAASVEDGDNIMTVPFGGGFAVGYRAFMADARFTYRQTYYNDLLRTGNNSSTLNTWGVSGQIGVAF